MRGRVDSERFANGKRGIFWEGEVDSESVAYSCKKGGRLWEEGVDSGRVAYRCLKGVYSERDGWILGVLYV